MVFLILTYPLTKFEILEYYQNESRFNGVYSRSNLPEKIEDGSYVIILDEYAGIEIHWIGLFCDRNEIFISVVLVLNMFLKKLNNLSDIKA